MVAGGESGERLQTPVATLAPSTLHSQLAASASRIARRITAEYFRLGMRSLSVIAALLLVGCSSGDTTEPSNGDSSTEGTFEIAYADVIGDDLAGGAINLTTDATRGRRLADLPNGPDFPTEWSPDGRTLLFLHFELGRSSLWLVEGDGSGLRRLTPESENVVGAGRWIAGTTRIAYVRAGDGELEWRTIRTDGSDPQSFLGARTFDMPSIAWSPDGAQIAFNKGSLPGLWIANADGSAPRQLTSGAYDYYPRWSPNGARIAFQTEPLDGTPSRRIGVVEVTGANRRVLTTGQIDERPLWSPDSRLIAFEKQILVNGVQVCTLQRVAAEGGPVVNLLPDRVVRACPSAAWRSAVAAR